MSYEGYVQGICQNGHLNRYAEHYGSEPYICPDCKSDLAWQNAVDQTNCDEWGFIPPSEFAKLLISAEKRQTCNLGHQHVVHHAIYRRPKEGELRQHYYDGTAFRPIHAP